MTGTLRAGFGGGEGTVSAGGPEGGTVRSIGIDEYLVKPVRQTRLRDGLAQVMGWVAEAPAAAATPRPEAPLHAARILLAEDHAINQKVALRLIESLGYRADAVANGREVIDALQRIPYDIVLMDCQMPEMDGYETTQHIRSHHDRPIHIIAIDRRPTA